ncbi:MAG: hypothetical protein U0414_11605 [Polyangiaceae bacterium]
MTTKKLCQFIAIESAVKNRVTAELTEAHKELQKSDLFNGHSRRYEPRNEDPTSPVGERLPEENKKVVARAEAIVKLTIDRLVEHYDLAATRDYGNCIAKADVEVDGKVLLKDVPVAHLLFLEKRVEDLLTFIRKLPTLDPTENWEMNASQDLFATAPVQSVRTKKISRALVLYEATKEHPAQVKEITEDVQAGTWSTIKYSSAIPLKKRNEMLRRAEELQKGIKFAREKANATEVEDKKVGRAVLDFVFGG